MKQEISLEGEMVELVKWDSEKPYSYYFYLPRNHSFNFIEEMLEDVLKNLSKSSWFI
jgi:hypothetical protein